MHGLLPFGPYTFHPQQDEFTLLADSAHPVEDVLIDNDAQPAPRSGRQTEERMNGPICLRPKLKQPFPPVRVN